MNDPPKNKDLEPFIINDIAPRNSDVRKSRRAWLKIIKSGKELGRKNVIARETYTQLVKERARVFKLPFFFDLSAFPLMSEPKLVSMEEVEELKAKF